VLGISAKAMVTFTLVLVSQIIGVALLPKTQGYTHIGWSLPQLSMFAISFAAMARLIRNGVDLGILIPLLSTVMPLASVAIGILAYGESASPKRVAMLAVACLLVGLAAKH
jgi:multidrug transporter EmrE-like cation transporter